MEHQGTLKLVETETDDQAYRLERRQDPRRVISGRVTALETDREDGPERNRICPLQLVDISDRGLGAIVQDPVEPNTRIAVFFQPHGPERGFDLYGRVVRCRRRDDYGYEIGIRFDARQAA